MSREIELRDYLAAKAMGGMVSNVVILGAMTELAKGKDMSKDDFLSARSYQIADAMIKARESKADE